MFNKSRKPAGVTKPVAAAFSAAMLAASIAPVANAAVNPFSASPLASGYGQLNMQNAGEATKPAEGSCGSHGDKPKCEGKCGEGKCGEEKKAKCEGKCGGMDGAKKDAAHEGKCGEGKCGGKAAK